jgi:hypothetical protein
MSEKITAPVDITALARYLDKVKDIASINRMMGAIYLKDFIEGQDVAGVLLAKAIQADVKAKARLEQAESFAYLDKASDFLKEKGVKDTSEARKMYINLDSDVMKAADDKARTEAMVTLLKNKLSILRQAHDDVKRILYTDQYQTPYEGM